MKKEIYKGTFGLTHRVWGGSYTAEIIVYYDEDKKEYEYDLKYDSSRERIWIEKDFLSLIRNVCDFIEYDFNFKNKMAFVVRLYSFLTKNNHLDFELLKNFLENFNIDNCYYLYEYSKMTDCILFQLIYTEDIFVDKGYDISKFDDVAKKVVQYMEKF